jgi:hypothetical protein
MVIAAITRRGFFRERAGIIEGKQPGGSSH